MKNNSIKGPFLHTPSNLVYSVTLMSGNIITSPIGFGRDIATMEPLDVLGLDYVGQVKECDGQKGLKPFDWEIAEERANWEEKLGFFADFGNVNDLLSDLHS